MIFNKKVSVIVVNWNGIKYLERCLLSLKHQTFNEKEIILVDNASTDGSVQLVAQQFPDVSIVKNPTNRGFAGGCNDGIRVANGAYIATLNNDAEAEPDWLEQMMNTVQRDQSIGMVAAKMLFSEWPGVINSTGISLDRAGIAWDRMGGQPDQASENAPVEIFGPCAGAALYNARMLREIGLFDEDFFMYLEDVDLAWRGRLAGWRCFYVPSAVVHHIHSASAVEGSSFKQHLLGRNKIWTIVKNYPTPQVYRYLPAILFYEVFSQPYTVLFRGNLAPLLGRLEAIRRIRTVWHKRKEVQSLRRVSSKELARFMDPLSSPLAMFRRYRHLGALLRRRDSQAASHTSS